MSRSAASCVPRMADQPAVSALPTIGLLMLTMLAFAFKRSALSAIQHFKMGILTSDNSGNM